MEGKVVGVVVCGDVGTELVSGETGMKVLCYFCHTQTPPAKMASAKRPNKSSKVAKPLVFITIKPILEFITLSVN